MKPIHQGARRQVAAPQIKTSWPRCTKWPNRRACCDAWIALPTLDSRPDDEILGYDDHGLPSLMVIDTSALARHFSGRAGATRFTASSITDAAGRD